MRESSQLEYGSIGGHADAVDTLKTESALVGKRKRRRRIFVAVLSPITDLVFVVFRLVLNARVGVTDGARFTFRSRRPAVKVGALFVGSLLGDSPDAVHVDGGVLGRDGRPAFPADQAHHEREHLVRVWRSVGILEQRLHLDENLRILSLVARALINLCTVEARLEFLAQVPELESKLIRLLVRPLLFLSELVARLRDQGLGIVLVSHDLHDVFALSDRVVVMKAGRIVASRETRELTREKLLELIVMGEAPV